VFEKKEVFRSSVYLSWARSQGGKCCLCGAQADELHHFGRRGMGRKGSDLMVARVCRECHARVQGLGTVSADRSGRTSEMMSLQADALELANMYLAEGSDDDDDDESKKVRW
jgi:hypothetical protein